MNKTCARHCESNAFEIEIRQLKRMLTSSQDEARKSQESYEAIRHRLQEIRSEGQEGRDDAL